MALALDHHAATVVDLIDASPVSILQNAPESPISELPIEALIEAALDQHHHQQQQLGGSAPAPAAETVPVVAEEAAAASNECPRARLERHCLAERFDQPTLVLSLELVEQQFRQLAAGLGPEVFIHYAVKANPHPAVIRRLVELGSRFDCASRGEIELCLAQGALPEHLSYGNTIKRTADIAFAHAAGVKLFAADAREELEKLAEYAPGCEVYVRLLVAKNAFAEWPLSKKFGCDGPTALKLIRYGRELGLKVRGISFHVGSQVRRADYWAPCLDDLSQIWKQAQAEGLGLDLLNIGGGFPATYQGPEVEPAGLYSSRVMELVRERFGSDAAYIMAEPGRGMTAPCGMLVSEVVLVGQKSEEDEHRWVYLSVGRFSGLAETEGESIRYQFVTPYDGCPEEELMPCVLAGPTCDSADVMYLNNKVRFCRRLRAGDRILIRNTGAYTSSYSSIGFNGFPPLQVVTLD